MNSINIIGRITADPELRRTQDNTAVCSYSLAVKRPRVKDASDFINCVTWRQGAEYLAQYGHKGDLVAVSGSLQSRKWEDKNGNKRTEWEVVTDSVELVSSKGKSEASGNTTQAQNAYPGGNSYPQRNFQQVDIPDAQLPF
jgi:single-strand DNA-binding protein